jgi:aspartyl protease family protein
MAIGFMTSRWWRRAARHSSAVLLAMCGVAASAAEIALVGLLPGRAIVVIDGGKRQTLAVGAATAEGVKLLAIEPGAAVFEAEGRRQRVQLGQHIVSSASAERPSITLVADGQGHFVTPGSINGASMRFIVDTGATFIALGASDARRAGIDAQKGTPGMAMTANGTVRVWKVKLASVKVGGIALSNVDASVHEHDMPIVLLGMSFLNRMEIRRDGQSMTLLQRY